MSTATMGRGRRLQALLVVALGTRFLAAPRPARSAEPSQADNAARREVTDETGRQVALPREIRRIVSLAPNLTETVFALGLGDEIVGDTDFCDYPPAAKSKPHVGGPIDPSIERIAALHPDLVLATRSINRVPTVRSLEQIGIPVYATDPHTVSQLVDSSESLGRLLGAGDAGEAMAAGLRERLSYLGQHLAGATPKSVFLVVWEEPAISTGRGTFAADALRLAGARSVIDTSIDWPTVSMEEVVRQQPEYVIFLSDSPEDERGKIAELRHRRGWSDLTALREGRVIILPDTFERPSPRLVDAIEELAQELHPERFGARLLGPAPGQP